MRFKTKQIKGKGRGKKIGFPTINLQIPKNLKMQEGIYAVWVEIEDKKYKGALHFGPVPTFGENEQSLEVYLIDSSDNIDSPTMFKNIEIEIVKRLREVKWFNNQEELVKQIDKDVQEVLYSL